MNHIVKSNVSPLSNGLAVSNTNRHILQILVRIRQLPKHQGLVLGTLGRICECNGGDFIPVDVEAYDGEGATLSETLRGTGVGAETVVEAGQVERLHAGSSDELNVGV